MNMRLTAGGIRELHWHEAAEWALTLSGKARLTAIDYEGKAFVKDVEKDDIWFFPPGVPHSIQGMEGDGVEFLLVFDNGNFSEGQHNADHRLAAPHAAGSAREKLGCDRERPGRSLHRAGRGPLHLPEGAAPAFGR